MTPDGGLYKGALPYPETFRTRIYTDPLQRLHLEASLLGHKILSMN